MTSVMPTKGKYKGPMVTVDPNKTRLPALDPSRPGYKATYNLEDIKKRITRARTQLVLKHTFFGTLALSMPYSTDEGLNPPTAATNGKWVKFHPLFVANLSDDELLFLAAHETLHPALEHVFRRGNRHPIVWNIACDVVINYILKEGNVGSMPVGGVYDKSLYEKCDGVADKIYDELMKNAQQQPQGGGDGGSGEGGGITIPDFGDALDDCQDGAPSGSAEANELEAEWKTRVVNAASAARSAGNLSAGLERLVTELLNPKVPWQELLQRFVVKAKSDTRSWARFNRRFVSQRLYLPSISGETMGPIAIAVDCSGSIGIKELNEFAAEIRAIKEDMNPTRIDVLYFDSSVSHFETYLPSDELNIQPHGGGGTAFSPIFRRFAEETEVEYVCCVVLTDLYCSDFGPPPPYPVMWVSNGTDQAPWGEVVLM